MANATLFAAPKGDKPAGWIPPPAQASSSLKIKARLSKERCRMNQESFRPRHICVAQPSYHSISGKNKTGKRATAEVYLTSHPTNKFLGSDLLAYAAYYSHTNNAQSAKPYLTIHNSQVVLVLQHDSYGLIHAIAWISDVDNTSVFMRFHSKSRLPEIFNLYLAEFPSSLNADLGDLTHRDFLRLDVDKCLEQIRNENFKPEATRWLNGITNFRIPNHGSRSDRVKSFNAFAKWWKKHRNSSHVTWKRKKLRQTIDEIPHLDLKDVSRQSSRLSSATPFIWKVPPISRRVKTPEDLQLWHQNWLDVWTKCCQSDSRRDWELKFIDWLFQNAEEVSDSDSGNSRKLGLVHDLAQRLVRLDAPPKLAKKSSSRFIEDHDLARALMPLRKWWADNRPSTRAPAPTSREKPACKMKSDLLSNYFEKNSGEE
ncbi:hypothetical protein JYT83_01535 [bacterium AH-315-F18]|nr:hypothetical protein [bacterium AH-315-F18]